MMAPVPLMEPVSREQIFQSDDWLYQVKWDGIRMQAYLNQGKVELFNRKLRRRTDQYPEIVQSLMDFPMNSGIVDGEVIAMEDRRPNFYKVLKRELYGKGKGLSSMMYDIPVYYVVFDLLSIDGTSLLNTPLEERLEKLKNVFSGKKFNTVQMCESFPDGKELWKATEEKGWEGIVMKERHGRYHPGKKHPTWLKIKHFKTLTATAVGALRRGEVVQSLLLGIREKNHWRYIGRAGSGLNEEERMLLTQFVPLLCQKDPSVINPPRNDRVTWLRPTLPVDIRYLEWTPEGTLRSPTIMGFRMPPKR